MFGRKESLIDKVTALRINIDDIIGRANNSNLEKNGVQNVFKTGFEALEKNKHFHWQITFDNKETGSCEAFFVDFYNNKSDCLDDELNLSALNDDESFFVILCDDLIDDYVGTNIDDVIEKLNNFIGRRI